jgi:sugar/nucleoside kinase (ribokinase family)
MMSPKYNMIAIGDSTQDVFLELSDASLQCDIDSTNCKICLDYADKIAVDKKTDIPAVGNAANHAIGVARLGLKTAIYTILGDDVQGNLSRDVFKENNVDAKYVSLDQEHGTNFSAVINFKGERTILVYHEPRQYQLPAFEATDWIYLTSASGDGVEELHDQVLKYLNENPGVKMAFNPGTHQMHLGKTKLQPLLTKTSILFLNRQESAEVIGLKTSDIKELVKEYHDLGVKTMVITDGPDGSYVSDGKQVWFLKIFRGPVVERTGAGDSYGSGFMSAIIKGKSIPQAMLWGNANSTSVVLHIGAREGLLKEDALLDLIQENSDIVPENFV